MTVEEQTNSGDDAMKTTAWVTSRRVARGILGLLGVLLALGIAIVGDAATLSKAHRDCAALIGSEVPDRADRGSALPSAVAAACGADGTAARFLSESVLAMQVNPQVGGFLLVGCGIGGFVYLGVRRRKTGAHETSA
jgi:hypothetical protein